MITTSASGKSIADVVSKGDRAFAALNLALKSVRQKSPGAGEHNM
jgi:hypothetical protein